MTLSMYQASIPVLSRGLKNLSALLDKAVAHAEAHKIDPAVLLAARLYPNMLPLVRQVQIATDGAKGCAARLAGVEVPKYEDKETTFAELQTRIASILAYLATFKPEQIDGSEERQVTLPLPSGAMKFTGQSFLLGFVLPNVTFHIVTTYNILRHNGVELGKLDYLGQI